MQGLFNFSKHIQITLVINLYFFLSFPVKTRHSKVVVDDLTTCSAVFSKYYGSSFS